MAKPKRIEIPGGLWDVEIPEDAPPPGHPIYERNRRQPGGGKDQPGGDNQLPLYDYVPNPDQIPPGWEPDGRGGYRRIEERDDDRDIDGGQRGVCIIQM